MAPRLFVKGHIIQSAYHDCVNLIKTSYNLILRFLCCINIKKWWCIFVNQMSFFHKESKEGEFTNSSEMIVLIPITHWSVLISCFLWFSRKFTEKLYC